MKLRVWGVTIAAVMVLAGARAEAQVTDGLELGLQVFNYDYKETFEGGSIKDEGRFTGFVASYGRPVGGFSLDARLNYAEGEIDYTASDGARLDDVQQTIAALELLVGRPIPASPGVTVTPFVGLGSRALLDESGGRETEEGAVGYDREVAYVYVPLGASARLLLENGAAAVFNSQFNVLVDGAVQSNFSDIDREFPDIENEFDEGYGLEFGAAIYTPVRSGRVGLAAFLRYWNLEQSKSVIYRDEFDQVEFFEPSNRTFEIGLKLTYGF